MKIPIQRCCCFITQRLLYCYQYVTILVLMCLASCMSVSTLLKSCYPNKASISITLLTIGDTMYMLVVNLVIITLFFTPYYQIVLDSTANPCLRVLQSLMKLFESLFQTSILGSNLCSCKDFFSKVHNKCYFCSPYISVANYILDFVLYRHSLAKYHQSGANNTHRFDIPIFYAKIDVFCQNANNQLCTALFEQPPTYFLPLFPPVYHAFCAWHQNTTYMHKFHGRINCQDTAETAQR